MSEAEDDAEEFDTDIKASQRNVYTSSSFNIAYKPHALKPLTTQEGYTADSETLPRHILLCSEITISPSKLINSKKHEDASQV